MIIKRTSTHTYRHTYRINIPTCRQAGSQPHGNTYINTYRLAHRQTHI